MQIGILTDEANAVASFESGGIIKIFESNCDSWNLVGSYDYDTEGLCDTQAFRNRLHDVCSWLGNCKILVAKRFRGTYRVIFEQYGISMYELAGFENTETSVLLNFIKGYAAESCQNTAKPGYSTAPPKPEEISPGNYFIDLVDFMGHKSPFNSKEILLPFLAKTSFSSFEILCEHIPKWFDAELDKLKYKMKISEKNNMISINLMTY
jgi:Iron only nitrogenase protein AnfO (AnfO_nitrog).